MTVYLQGVHRWRHVATPDGKVHIFDWKTCSWGWDAKRRSEPMTTYQLTLYKHFFARKMGVLIRRMWRRTSLFSREHQRRIKLSFSELPLVHERQQNALKLLNKALYNIKNKRYIKNRLSCRFCAFNKTEHCR